MPWSPALVEWMKRWPRGRTRSERELRQTWDQIRHPWFPGQTAVHHPEGSLSSNARDATRKLTVREEDVGVLQAWHCILPSLPAMAHHIFKQPCTVRSVTVIPTLWQRKLSHEGLSNMSSVTQSVAELGSEPGSSAAAPALSLAAQLFTQTLLGLICPGYKR